MMTTLTPDAQRRLEQYLRQIHLVLSGCRTVSAEEVERDVREHIEREFPAEAETVSLSDLDPVLERLGSPGQWVPVEDLPWWRRLLLHMRSGPEDWRFAYLALGLLVAGWVLAPFVWALPCIPLSFLVARAALALAREKNEDLGAQKWFLYPSLLVVYASLLWAVFLGPPVGAGGAAIQQMRSSNNADQPDIGLVSVIMIGTAALWWFLLGIALWIWPQVMPAVFRPFADGFNSNHARRLVFVGLALGMLLAIAVPIRRWALGEM